MKLSHADSVSAAKLVLAKAERERELMGRQFGFPVAKSLEAILAEHVLCLGVPANRLHVKVLASILARANTGPALPIREAFYRVKRHLLEGLGVPIGSKVQVIDKRCWGDRSGCCPGRGCSRCSGSGIFDRRVILHHEYELGGHHFLVPVQELTETPHRVDIVGKVPRNPLIGSHRCSVAIVAAFAPHLVRASWIDPGQILKLVASIGPVPPSLLIPAPPPSGDDIPF